MNLFNESQTQKLPLIYLPNFRKPNSTPIYNPNHATPKETREQTLIFKFANLTMNNEMQKIVAVSCIEKANRRLGNKVTSDFSLLVKDPSNGTIKIDTICVKEVVTLESFKNIDEIDSKNSSWADHINADELSIAKGNKPIDCRSWISSPVEEGMVMTISSDSNVTVIVTVATTTDVTNIVAA